MAGENYIGSVISLISLSDIRYVGTLHSINAQDSTVGLKQVRSYGTEGRRGKPEEEILPTDNVFDYVVFRGSDIKDLQVFEAPKPAFPQPQTNLPQDPAIMSMGYAPPMNPYNNMYPPPQQQQQQPPSNNNTYWQQPTPSAASAVPPPPAAFPPSTLEADEKAKQEQEALEELKAELEEADQPTINEAAIEELAKKVSEMNPAEDKVKVTSPPSTRRTNEYRGRGGRFNNNNNRQYNSNSKKEFTIPNSEFDFEASNAKFDKSEIKKEDDLDDSENEVEIPEPEEFYDKKSSFFDNISCESKERSEQQNEPRRNRFHEERKLNMETFGQATVDQSRYRNNFRGRGNSGYRNNRGGYYRNNNRNYNNNNNNNYRQNNKSQQQDQD